MRDAITTFRKSGKKVTAFLEYGGDREYYLASAADRVFLMPTSSLDLTGVASYEMFLRGTFDKIGAYPDFVHIGDYKTAPNQYTQKGFTPAHREMAQSLNRDMYEQLVAGVAEGRKKSEDEVRTLFDRGPFIAAKALEAGLVDELAYKDELDDRVPELGGDSDRRIEGSDYQRISFESAGVRPRSRIAVLYIVGTIASGKGGFDPVNGSIAGSESIVEQIRKIRDDNSIKAIVLRIDSPGGSSVASDVIWRELAITRLDNPSRPIVTSMSDLAASGGYYIAIPADAIVAQPGTLTGSIGIFGGKIVIGGTLGKAGVGTETVTSGANADMYSPFTPFTAPQRAKVEEFMQDFYKGFVGKVAESRKTTPKRSMPWRRGVSGPAVRRLRTGWWTGLADSIRPCLWRRNGRRFRPTRTFNSSCIPSVATSSMRSRSSSAGQVVQACGACWRARANVAPSRRCRHRRGSSGVANRWHSCRSHL